MAEDATALPRLQGLAPHVAPDTLLLILGSFPGVASLQAQQYYGHPRNQFWRLLSDVFDLPLLGADYGSRLQILRQQQIGLWDVISETQRKGSLDSQIRQPQASDLHTLLATLPALRMIAFNGGTASRMGLMQLGPVAERYKIFQLPSSSPAYTLPYAGKLAASQQTAPEFFSASQRIDHS